MFDNCKHTAVTASYGRSPELTEALAGAFLSPGGEGETDQFYSLEPCHLISLRSVSYGAATESL